MCSQIDNEIMSGIRYGEFARMPFLKGRVIAINKRWVGNGHFRFFFLIQNNFEGRTNA